MKSDENLDLFRHSDAEQARANRVAAEAVLINPWGTQAWREARSRHYAQLAEHFEGLLRGASRSRIA